MMTKTFLKWSLSIAIYTSASAMLVAQQDTSFRHQIKLSPLRAINMFTPGMEVSYEFRYRKFATQLSLAYLKDIFNVLSNDNYKGYRINLEEKYFVKKGSNSRFRNYFALETGYQQVKMNSQAGFVPYQYLNADEQTQKENTYVSDHRLSRTSVIMDAKYGIEFMIHHFTIDLSAGIGATYQNVKYSDKRNPADEVAFHFEDIISPLFLTEGKYFIFNMPLSLKVGIQF